MKEGYYRYDDTINLGTNPIITNRDLIKVIDLADYTVIAMHKGRKVEFDITHLKKGFSYIGKNKN